MPAMTSLVNITALSSRSSPAAAKARSRYSVDSFVAPSSHSTSASSRNLSTFSADGNPSVPALTASRRAVATSPAFRAASA